MLKSIVDSLDAVPEALHEYYAPRSSGGFHLLHDGAEALGNALRDERRKLKSAESSIRELETQVGALRARLEPEAELTPKERFFADARRRLSKLQPGTPEAAAEMEAIEREMQPLIDADVAIEIKRHEDDIASLRAQIQHETIKQATRDIVRTIARQDCGELLTPHVQARLGCEERNGKYELVVLDAGGKPSAHTVEALVDELRDTPNLRPFTNGTTAETKEAHQRRVAAMLAPSPAFH